MTSALDPAHSAGDPTDDPPDDRTEGRVVAGERTARPKSHVVPIAVAAVLVCAAAVAVALGVGGGGGIDWQTADIGEQGVLGSSMVEDGARLDRRDDGILVEFVMPTPQPGTYEYPTADNVPPDAEPHPPISRGAADAPEVFTLWLFAFNEPARCTDECNNDDFAPGAAARGGVYQVDGRIADGDELRLVGPVRLGEPPLAGVPLDDPDGAEIHVAIAPHGRVLAGADGWRQLNGPVGDPTHWWGARLPAP